MLLAFFRSATKQNDDEFAVFREVDSIAGTEIDPALINATADALRVGEIPQSDTVESRRYLAGCLRIQSVEPFAKRASTALVLIFKNIDHD